jgi:O-antigen chain-terminating methyltransferase
VHDLVTSNEFKRFLDLDHAEEARHFLHAEFSDEAFVDQIYRLVLGRKPEPEVRHRLVLELAEGRVSRTAIVRDLVSSDEFQRVHELDEAAVAKIVPPPDLADKFVDEAYRLLLRRSPDAGAREEVRAGFGQRKLSRAAFVHAIAESEEFESIRLLDDAIARALAARTTGNTLGNLSAPPGTDERLIEIPWALARYRGEQRVLEVGYAFAMPAYLAALLSLGADELVGVDLAEATVPGMKTVRADARDLPFPRGSFDFVFCISTLEHVGRDNRMYGLGDERDNGAAASTLRELRRVLARGGRLVVTVPCGEPEDHGWLVQYDVASWLRIFRQAGFFVLDAQTYELKEGGWRRAREFDAAGARYGERGPGASAVLCVELRRGRVWRTLRRRLGTAVRRVNGGPAR